MQFMLEKGFQIRIHIAWNKMACERCSKCETLLIKRTCQWDVNQMCSMNFLTKWVLMMNSDELKIQKGGGCPPF